MRVACPECAAEYDLPPELAARLGEGRTVRCARCGTAWAPPPPAGAEEPADGPAAEPVTPALPGPPASLRPDPPRLPPAVEDPPAARPDAASPGRRAVAAAWAASFLLLAAAAVAAWAWRVEVVEAWPPAARVFVALGLAG